MIGELIPFALRCLNRLDAQLLSFIFSNRHTSSCHRTGNSCALKKATTVSVYKRRLCGYIVISIGHVLFLYELRMLALHPKQLLFKIKKTLTKKSY